jgi:hypothetical protein
MGDELDPAEITKLLGTEPTHAEKKGDKIVGKKTGTVRIVKAGSWRLTADDREPEDLDGQIQEILSKTTQNFAVWQDLGKRFEIDLFCGLFMNGTNEGLSISATSLKALGDRGIEIGLDIYGGRK